MVEIQRDVCIGCGLCAADCIAGSLEIRDGKAVKTRDCILCGHCVAICPTGAVSIPGYDMADVEEIGPGQAALDPDRLLKAIKFRRSVRDFKEKPVSREDLALLTQAGRYTATAKNSQGCRFIFVQKELAAFKSMIWSGIGRALKEDNPDAGPFRGFYKEHMTDPRQDYLFRNAPAVLFIATDNSVDAGLAAQNMELLAVSRGLGFLYNGYLRRAAEMNPEARAWLGAGDKQLQACALLGHPAVEYKRTAPRRAADVILK